MVNIVTLFPADKNYGTIMSFKYSSILRFLNYGFWELIKLEKLYQDDSYIRDFKADILDVITGDGRILLVLNRTAFYPEGGGQPSDMGRIGECIISYVFEKDDIIYHVSDRMPESIKDVDCSIDWPRRLDHMQQHCGQHILSSAFDKLLGGATVGFHLGDEYVTVDISLDSLLPQDADRVEKLANQIVYENRTVKYHYPDQDELPKFTLRKAPSVTENIRIVEVQGFDLSPCGGTHPSHTGEIGIIKIRRWEKYKSSIRVEFICGMRALDDYMWKNRYINEISNILSSSDKDVLESVKRYSDELNSSRKDIKQLKDALLTYEASELYNGADEIKGIKIVKKLFSGRDFKELTNLGGKLSQKTKCISLLGLKSDNAQMIFTRSDDIDIKINELFKETLPLINGKGGGSPRLAQGGGTDVSNLESALDSAYIILKNRHLQTK